MTNTVTAQKSTRTRQNRVFVLLLVFAALSSVMKDLDQLQTLMSNIHGLTASWLHVGSVYASGISPVEASCVKGQEQAVRTEEFHWTGQVAAGQSVEIKGINGSVNAEPSVGSDIEVVAVKKAQRSDPASVRIKVVAHANGVTICALYPNDYDQQPACEPGGASLPVKVAGSSAGADSGRNGVRNNDVSVNFKVRIPAGVSFIGRTVNGEVSATSLTGNVDVRTVNGSINLSTTGYAQAKTVNGEITAKLGNPNWPDALEFKTVNGSIDLDLPAALSTKIEADVFNGDISSDFPLTVLGRISRKHITGTIGSGGRELLLKTLNGSIRLRHIG